MNRYERKFNEIVGRIIAEKKRHGEKAQISRLTKEAIAVSRLMVPSAQFDDATHAGIIMTVVDYNMENDDLEGVTRDEISMPWAGENDE
jgi:hypothetical protein